MLDLICIVMTKHSVILICVEPLMLMQFAPGTDFICSGYSSTQSYDNMFAGSNWDAEDYDDWTDYQRDLKVNGGLIPARRRNSSGS